MFWFVAAGVLLVVLALSMLVVSRRMRVESGLPSGRVVGSDVGISTRGKTLYSATYGLSGTPDYLVETEDGVVPVEVKPSRTEKEPHESHLLQVLAYCLLVEETTGKRPPYGLLRYSSDTFKVDYNRETRTHLLAVIEEMREAAQQREVHRSHEVPGKCWGCVYRSVCEESLT
jgi:CRISPR-associated exonuclease Cas4